MELAASFVFENCSYYMPFAQRSVYRVGAGKKDDIAVKSLPAAALTFRRRGEVLSVLAKAPFRSLDSVPCNRPVPLSDDGKAWLGATVATGMAEQTFSLPYNGVVTLGRGADNHICLSLPFISVHHMQIRCENGTYTAEDMKSTNGVFVNGRRVGFAKLHTGDVIEVFTCRIHLREGVLSFENVGLALAVKATSHAARQAKTERAARRRPTYHPSLRTRERLPAAPIQLAAPPPLPKPNFRTSEFSANALMTNAFQLAADLIRFDFSTPYMLARTAGLIPSVIQMVQRSKQNKRRQAELEQYLQRCVQRYTVYLCEQNARINQVRELQRRIVTYENPSPGACVTFTRELNKRLWERRPADSDFLSVRVGMGYEPLCVDVTCRRDSQSFQVQTDAMEELVERIVAESRYVDRIPTRLALDRYTGIGVIGSRRKVQLLMRDLLIELTVLHSPQDVKLAGIFDREEQARWSFIRWLPHIWDDDRYHRFLAFDRQDGHALCERLGALIRERTEAPQRPLPHYVVLLGSRAQVYGEPVYHALLSSVPRGVGVTVFYLFDETDELPPDCDYILDVGETACGYERNAYNERVYFSPDSGFNRREMHDFARRMAAIEPERPLGGRGDTADDTVRVLEIGGREAPLPPGAHKLTVTLCSDNRLIDGYDLDIPSDMPVSALKHAIAAELNRCLRREVIAGEGMSLRCRRLDRLLSDSETPEEAGVQSGDCLILK